MKEQIQELPKDNIVSNIDDLNVKKLYIAKHLKGIIKKELGINIDIVSRVKHIVEARYIYCLILREKEFNTFKFIGDTINKNHATILHGHKSIKTWIEADNSLNERYSKILYRYYTMKYGKRHALKLIQQESLPVISKGTVIPYDFINLISKVPSNKLKELKIRIETFIKMLEFEKTNKEKTKEAVKLVG